MEEYVKKVTEDWMMSWKLVAERWLNFSGLDQELKEQLDRVKHDETQLEELFGKNLEFGTAGMRGEIGPGTNRMNIYTVRKASEGLARYLLSEDEKNAQTWSGDRVRFTS